MYLVLESTPTHVNEVVKEWQCIQQFQEKFNFWFMNIIVIMT